MLKTGRLDRNFILIQILLWCFILFGSTSNRIYEIPFWKAFLVAMIDVIHAMWIVYGHIFLALPLITKKRQYLRYVVVLFLIVFSGVAVITYVYLVYYPVSGPCHGEGTLHNLTIGSTIESIFYLILSTPIKFSYDYFKLQSRHQQLASEKLNAELKYLKLQVNPHFLFNTLNNLLYLTRKKSSHAPTVVEKLSHLMRYMLETSQQENIDLKSEVEFIRAYIELEKLRIKNIEVNINTDQSNLMAQIPPLLLLTLVENAFKHGIDKSKDNYIFIEIKTEAGQLSIVVENKIVEEDAKILGPEHGGNLGLDNLRKRLELIFGSDYELSLLSKNNEFQAKMTIPTL